MAHSIGRHERERRIRFLEKSARPPSSESPLKVQRRENFLAPYLNFVLFYSYLSLNIKGFFDRAIIKGDAIFPLTLRLRGIDFSLN